VCEAGEGYEFAEMKGATRVPHCDVDVALRASLLAPDSPPVGNPRRECLPLTGERYFFALLGRGFSARMRKILHSTVQAAIHDEYRRENYRDLEGTKASSESGRWPFEFSYGARPFPETSHCSMNFS